MQLWLALHATRNRGRAPAAAMLLRSVGYAAFCLAVISLRLIRTSAICTALSAAPLRRLSDTIHMLLGRQAIGGGVLVDPASSFRQPRLRYKVYEP